MAWTAADFALIITTSATAITSLSSIVWPTINNYFTEKKSKKKEVEDLFFTSVMFCVENVEKIISILANRGMRKAFLSADKTIKDDPEGDELVQLFSTHARKIELYGKKYEVETIYFTVTIRSIIAVGYDFEYVDNKLQYVGGNEEMKKAILMRSNLVDELIKYSTDLIKAAENIKL